MISVLSWLEGFAVWAGAPAAARKTVKTWRVRHQTRRALARLSPHELDDIGLTPEQAQRESSKAFWEN